MDGKPVMTRELLASYAREWVNEWRLSLSAVGILAFLLHRDDPYGPTSTEQLLAKSPKCALALVEKAVAELVDKGFLEPEYEASHFRGVYPTGDARRIT